MIKDYEQVLPNIEQNIINKIRGIEKRRLMIKQGIYSAISLSSLFGLFFAIKYVISNISNSGMYDYISLIWNDISILSYWKELLYTITESTPFLGLALSFAVLSLFLWSMLKAFRVQVFRSALIV